MQQALSRPREKPIMPQRKLSRRSFAAGLAAAAASPAQAQTRRQPSGQGSAEQNKASQERSSERSRNLRAFKVPNDAEPAFIFKA